MMIAVYVMVLVLFMSVVVKSFQVVYLRAVTYPIIHFIYLMMVLFYIIQQMLLVDFNLMYKVHQYQEVRVEMLALQASQFHQEEQPFWLFLLLEQLFPQVAER